MNKTIFILFVVIGFLNPILVFADSPAPPESYTIKFGDYVFVMLADQSPEYREYYMMENSRFYKKNCNKKTLDRWDKKHCEAYEAVKRYSKSGLYHKNNPSKALWTVDWYAFGVYVSSDGQHLVRAGGWAGSGEGLAVSFYKQGKLLAEYRIDDLVDDESKLIRSVSHFFWRSDTNFDDNASTYFIKTNDNNEFTFDIRTGKIVKYKYNPPPVYDADIEFKNGDRQSYADFRACSGMSYIRYLQGEGLQEHYLYTTKARKSAAVDVGMKLDVIPIPFQLVKNVRLIQEIDKQKAIWEISQRDGGMKRATIDQGFLKLCGKNKQGEEQAITIMQIAKFSLSKAKLAKPKDDIRTVAQRMHWDKESWVKAWAVVCDNTDIKKYKTLSDMEHLLAKFRQAECSAESKQFLATLAKVGGWIRKQPRTEQLTKFARDVAKLNGEKGQKNQSISLYDYVIGGYERAPGEDEKSYLYRKENLIEEVLYTNKLRRKSAEAQKYVALLKEIHKEMDLVQEAERKKRNAEEKEKVNDFQKYIENLTVESIEPDHDYLAREQRLLFERQCNKYGAALNMEVVAIYHRVVDIEERLHPSGHFHTFKALMALSSCLHRADDKRQTIEIYQKALNLGSMMIKKSLIKKADLRRYSYQVEELVRSFKRGDRPLREEVINLYYWELSIWKKFAEKFAEINTLRDIAYAYQSIGNLDKAEESLVKRIQLSKNLDDDKSETWIEKTERDLKYFYKRTNRKPPTPVDRLLGGIKSLMP